MKTYSTEEQETEATKYDLEETKEAIREVLIHLELISEVHDDYYNGLMENIIETLKEYTT